MSEGGEPIWRSDIDSLAFCSGHNGSASSTGAHSGDAAGLHPVAAAEHRLLSDAPGSFEAAARAKLAAKDIRDTENFHLTSRDVRRRLKNSVASDDAVG